MFSIFKRITVNYSIIKGIGLLIGVEDNNLKSFDNNFCIMIIFLFIGIEISISRKIDFDQDENL